MRPVVFRAALPHAAASGSPARAIDAAGAGTSPGRPHREARSRPLRTAAVLLAHLLLGGTAASVTSCSADLPSTGVTPGAAVRLDSRTGGPPDPEVVLKRSAEQLHTDVDAVRDGLPVRMIRRFLDERQQCELDATDIWPAQWILDQRIYLTVDDARLAGRSIAERFAANGWKVRTQPGAGDADQYTFHRRGYQITLAAARDDGSLNLQTNGPCVNADGTVATTTTPS
jgi:hypothetical protein